jgi:predicted benzoate:H+ symporter BenE
MTDLHQQIADLEAEVDNLSDAAERCRKTMILAKIATGVGIILVGASLLGLMRSDPVLVVIGITATLAGISLLGSSRGSLDQITEKISAYEARRAELINRMDLHVIETD